MFSQLGKKIKKPEDAIKAFKKLDADEQELFMDDFLETEM